MNTPTRLVAFLLVLAMAVARTFAASQTPLAAPAGCSPALEQATADLAEGRLDAARAGFSAVIEDASAMPLARSLAMFGLAETFLAKNDGSEAVQIWQRLAADATYPQLHREIARRRIAEGNRIQRGLPAFDASMHRVELAALPEPAVVLHVAPGGSDANDGSEAKPFVTLTKARDAIRAFKQGQGGKLPRGGVRVLVHGGVYPVQQSFSLVREDSGTVESPVVYMARAGESPVFDGGIRLVSWKPIADADLRGKLDPSVRERVIEADLKTLGVKDWGDPTALRLRPELFCNGVPQTLARWPNAGFIETGEILGTDTFKVWNTISGCRDGKFRYVEDRPNRWTDEADVRLYGYWFWDWYEEYQKVASIDPGGRIFTLAKPYSSYGYRKDQRYFAANLFREIDQPGEWYLDRRSGMVYWLPPEGVDAAQATVTLSVFAKPFVTMEDVEHVSLVNLLLQEARGDGIHIRNGANCLVAGCTVRRLGGDAIVVQGGARHGIFGCTMHTLGCGGVRVAGGDRKTLIAGEHFVENCTVFDISRLKRTYTPAVHLDGCGNRVAHNLFERMPSSAMRIEGNDHLIELNVIRQVVQESDDQGGIDMFGNPLYRGVVIRWNHWSDITGGTECGAAGVRLDDMICGIAIYGNIFQRCGAVQFGGVQVHGGKDNLIDNNVFFDCHAGMSFSRWGEKRWLEMIQRFLGEASAPPYSTRYPDLARLKAEPDVNLVSRNVFAGCKSIFLRDGGMERSALNAVMDRPVDLSVVSDPQVIRRHPQLRRLMFDPIPTSEIGPYAHPWRAATSSDSRR